MDPAPGNPLKKILSAAELTIIVLFALAPVFASFPYRINIFLSWEGAWRLSNGEVPYRDFGMPLGYMYWVIPALFFKIFGAQMITLVKAQAFINILSGLAFRSICRSLGVQPLVRFASVLVFVLSYSFFNYWPWYNHTVIVYEFIALAFLLRFLLRPGSEQAKAWRRGANLFLAGMFTFFSFFTKQDGGGLAFLLCLALLAYDGWLEKRWKPAAIYLGGLLLTGLLIIVPLTAYNFGYWFNHGQPPHNSRISITDIIAAFFAGSQWIKFYLLLIVLLLLATVSNWKAYLRQKTAMLFTLLTLGILAEASIFQVTSYVPEDNNIFFHSFAFLFLLSLIAGHFRLRLERWPAVFVLSACVMLWWSSVFWKYVQRFVLRGGPENYASTVYEGYRYADVVNNHTFMIELDTTNVPLSQWRSPDLPSFRKILMPGPTVDGIDRLLQMPVWKSNPAPRVLNMTELTPLARDIPFKLETGPNYPLWFHRGVAVFDREVKMFTNRIRENYYDVVMYEYIPYLNNFYPYAVRSALQENYRLADRFIAPRNPSNHAWVEVYVKKN